MNDFQIFFFSKIEKIFFQSMIMISMQPFITQADKKMKTYDMRTLFK